LFEIFGPAGISATLNAFFQIWDIYYLGQFINYFFMFIWFIIIINYYILFF
jgi:hypothetical protein